MRIYFDKLIYEGECNGKTLYSIQTSTRDLRGILGEEHRKEIITEAIWKEIGGITGEVYIKAIQDK